MCSKTTCAQQPASTLCSRSVWVEQEKAQTAAWELLDKPMISGTWYSWCLNWGGKCGDMSIPCSNTPEQSPGPAPLWGTGGRGLGPHHQNQNSGSPLGCVSQHPLLCYSGTQFTRMMNCASLLFKKDRRCVSGGLCVVHLLDLLSQELAKSGRATQVHFVPSADLFFSPRPRRAVTIFSL